MKVQIFKSKVYKISFWVKIVCLFCWSSSLSSGMATNKNFQDLNISAFQWIQLSVLNCKKLPIFLIFCSKLVEKSVKKIEETEDAAIKRKLICQKWCSMCLSLNLNLIHWAFIKPSGPKNFPNFRNCKDEDLQRVNWSVRHVHAVFFLVWSFFKMQNKFQLN